MAVKKEDFRKIESRFLAGTLIFFGLLSFFVLREFFYYIIGGALLVFAFYPVHRRLRRLVRHNAAASFLSFLLVVAVVIGPLVLVGFLIFQDAVNFARTYDPEHLNERVDEYLEPYGVGAPRDGNNNTTTSDVANFLGNTIQRFAARVGSEMLQILPNLAIGLVITAFVIYYGFSDGESFYAKLRHAVPLPDEIEERLFLEIRRVTSVVFVGNILVSVLGGIVGAITFVVVGVDNAVFWGFVMIILGILPVVGAPLIWIPAAAFEFIKGDKVDAIIILVVNGVFVIGYIDNILRPKLIGKVAHIHPVLVLTGVLGGVEAFGPLGFVIGPLVLAVFIALIRAYTEWHPRWKERTARGVEAYHPGAQIDIVEKGHEIGKAPVSEEPGPPAKPT